MHLTLKPDRLYVTVDILILTVKDGKLSLMLSRRLDPTATVPPAAFLRLKSASVYTGRTFCHVAERLYNILMIVPGLWADPADMPTNHRPESKRSASLGRRCRFSG